MVGLLAFLVGLWLILNLFGATAKGLVHLLLIVALVVLIIEILQRGGDRT